MACAETKVPYLGIEWQLLMHEDAGVHPQNGVVVTRVMSDSPACKAGLNDGDIILSIDGNFINAENSITRLIMQHKPGGSVTLGVLRGSKRSSVKLTLGSRVVPVLKFASVAHQR